MTITLNGDTGITTPDMEVNSASAMGYTTGAGGTVTQLTSKSTAVTLNTPVGQITTAADALAAGAIANFACNNSTVSVADVIIVNVSGAGQLTSYSVQAAARAGSFAIALKNETAGSLSNAVVISFAIIKGATS